mmetsp:Transcript_30076/g.65769  ORF Transcript_30076/g.65769 Transcript_30076/m.65769 type:complete len:197 (+) Transcript_30076:30-620(+)
MSSQKKDLYKILGVSPDATTAQLKLAHRDAVLRNHPDIVGQSPETLEKFREVQDAYKILSTKELKSEYDKSIKPTKPDVSGNIVPGSATANIYNVSHDIQKKNFEEHVLMNASSSWAENIPKYKTEKWKKVPLSEKKMSRVRPLWGPVHIAKHSFPYIVLLGFSVGLYAYMAQPKIRFSSTIDRIQPLIREKEAHH